MFKWFFRSLNSGVDARSTNLIPLTTPELIMLSAPTANEIASASSSTSTNMSATDMETQQQLAIPIEASREKMTRSQPSSEVAQVDGDPANTVYQERLAQIKTLFAWRATETEVSLHVGHDNTQTNNETDKTSKDNALCKNIALCINAATENTWRKARIAHGMIASSISTTSSPNGSGKPSSGPDSDDERGASPDTDRTSYPGSDDGKTTRKLRQALMVTGGRYGILQDDLRDAKDAQYQALNQKYAEQRAQRLNDKRLVDQWSQEVADMEAYCQQVDETNRDLNDRFVEAAEKHQAEVKAKDLKTATLKADHDLAIAAQREETEKWQQECLRKESTFQKSIEKVTAQREDIKRKANLEKRKILKANRVKIDDLKSKNEVLEMKNSRIAAEYYDAMSQEEETIISLMARIQQFEKEHETMSQMVRQKFTTGSELQRVLEADVAGKEEAAERRAEVQRLRTHVENLLDTIQNTETNVTRHREAEQDSRAALNRSQKNVHLLDDKLALKTDQIRDLAKQLEQVQQGNVVPGAHCAALDAIDLENEQLRNSLQAERDEKSDLQAKLDKVDSDHLKVSVEYGILEAKLIEEKKSHSKLGKSTEAMMHELNMLRKVARSRQGALGEQDQSELLDLVSGTAATNQSLLDTNAQLQDRLEEIEQWSKTIVDKCESDVMIASSDVNYWYHLYFNEAVATTERLHNEIAALKAEKGEQHFVEPAPPANPEIHDRKTLAFAMAHGLQGVPPELISATFYDSTSGVCLSPTEAALKALRPQGWYPIYIAGKVWLSKMVAALSEEQAAMRIEAGDHNASQGSAGSARSSVSNTYAPRGIDFATTSDAHNNVADNASDPRTPLLTRASSRRTHSPITPGRDDRTSIPTQARKAKPQVVRRVARSRLVEVSQIPEYQSSWQQIDERMTRDVWEGMDEELRVHWATDYLRIEDD
ncbi:uncharacterized protein J4E88_006187 [Alternaria novae-zelandiae]|uniref:uncharacterized protein n=1 Tax=Alternaria novae-zelandiae TaxID=430562 RepID=UPI0020C568B4|nr:uncharacterized protein J4E88_006187 [Alternaria novae-zelandiae]KAI4678899.1 hypothetical protein J4E88_006187 [Alternaria novae-zelandiae]